MNKLFLNCAIFILINLTGSLWAQPNETAHFQKTFHKCSEYLYYARFDKALPLLMEMDSLDPKNPNINYLIGVCYIASAIKNEEAISRLEFADKYISNSYLSNNYKERNCPVYLKYYLGIAYCFAWDCEQANRELQEFKSIINDPFNSFIVDIEGKVINCKAAVKAKKKEETVAFVDDPKKKPLGDTIITRKVIYSTKTPLYGVQVAAALNSGPSVNFGTLKNVRAFVDKNGVIRYIIGSSVMRSSAEYLRKAVAEAGYKDAFIIDVNQEELYSQEIVNSRKNKLLKKAEYRVQIGAFRNEIPPELSKIYLTLDGIKETSQDGLTVLSVGSFKSHEDAKTYKNELVEKGIPGAFVVVFENGKKVMR